MSITFSTCWYIFKCKFDPTIYQLWIDNMLSNVNNYNLVIYSDINSSTYLLKYLQNSRIKLIIKPYEDFYGYKYKDFWIENHTKNTLLNDKIDWKVNMLWCEKIYFVHETIQNKYFDTQMYGWCDIGYFRNRQNDMNNKQLTNWPSDIKINSLAIDKIHYALVNNNLEYINYIQQIILNKNENNLPINQIPANQTSIAGGFFICHIDKIKWWVDIFDSKLKLYIKHNYLVKDDQMILIDCIFTENKHFILHKENNILYDNWFMFQRLLI